MLSRSMLRRSPQMQALPRLCVQATRGMLYESHYTEAAKQKHNVYEKWRETAAEEQKQILHDKEMKAKPKSVEKQEKHSALEATDETQFAHPSHDVEYLTEKLTQKVKGLFGVKAKDEEEEDLRQERMSGWT